jgi:hypothetical protein
MTVVALDKFTQRRLAVPARVAPFRSKVMPAQGVKTKSKCAATAPELRHNGALTHEFGAESGNKSRF